MMKSDPPSEADISDLIKKLTESGYDASEFEKNRSKMEALLNQVNPYSTEDTLSMIATYAFILYDYYGPEATENPNDDDYQMLISAAFSVGYNIGLGPEHASALPIMAIAGMHAALGQQAIIDYHSDNAPSSNLSAPKEVPPMEIPALIEKLTQLGDTETANEVSKNRAQIEKMLTNANPYSDAQTTKLITHYASMLKDNVQSQYATHELLTSSAFAVGYAIGQGPELTNMLPLMAIAGMYSDLGKKATQTVKAYAEQWKAEDAAEEEKQRTHRPR